MKRVILATLCLATLTTAVACAATSGRKSKPVSTVVPQEISQPVLASAAPEAPAPAAPAGPAAPAATQPAEPALPEVQPPLPPGHPSMEQMQAAQQQKQQGGNAPPQLPSGHPDISKMKAQGGGMPPGVANGQLPAGHPDISQMRRQAASQPSLIGTVLVRAVQGTKNGPAIGAGAVVTLELYEQDQVLEKREGKLDETGAANFERLPIGMSTTPLAHVNYNGVEYEAVGQPLDPTHASQTVQVTAYESTDQQPAWQVKMQHLLIQPAAEGVSVMEMFAVENPTDRAWIGSGAPNAEGKRATTVFPLPAGAKDVQLAGGFHECCAKVEGDKVTNSMALVPGVSQFRIVYTVPVKDGKAELALSTPAAIGHLMAMLPDDGTTVSAVGLENGGTANMGNGITRFFKGENLKAGASFKLNISGITATTGQQAGASSATPAGAAGPAAATAMSGQMAKVLAGAGGLFIFVVGGMFLLVKGPKASKNAKKAK